jgi:hypothetical protein
MKAAAKRSVVAVSPGRAAALKAWETMRSKGIVPGKPKPPRPKLKLVPHTPIKMPKQVGVVSASQMMARTVVLVLTISGIGNRRKVNLDAINITAKNDKQKAQQQIDDQWLGVTKKLFDSEELDEITSIGNEARQWVENRALPSHIKKGVYLLPIDFIEETNTKLKEFEARRKPLVEKMIRRLDEHKAEAKARLRDLFDEDQYPTPNQLRAAFSIRWRFVYVDSAKNLEAVSKEIYEEERKKAEASWAETRETIKQLLRTQLSEMVNHLVDKLKTDTDGKVKIFRESSIGKMEEFLGTFDARNIVNDQQMKILVDKAKSLIKTADVERLRTDKSVRDYVRHGFETIKVLLDPMVVDKPHRRIIVED